MNDYVTNVTKIISDCISRHDTSSQVAFQDLPDCGIRIAKIRNKISVSYYPCHNDEKVIAVAPNGLDTKRTVEWCIEKVLPYIVRHYYDMLYTMFTTDGIVVEYSGRSMILKCMTVPDNDNIVSIIATGYEYIALYHSYSPQCSISPEFVRIITDLLRTSRQEREVFLKVNNALVINGLPDIVADYLWFVPKEYKEQIFITDKIIVPDDPDEHPYIPHGNDERLEIVWETEPSLFDIDEHFRKN
jgi:hypothetical protein